MKYTALNAEQLRGMLLNGAASLARHKEEINSLNVFPVPDGDTGTNMNLTVESANREMMKSCESVKVVADALAMGSLMGARGNSGVILSQIFRGFSQGLAAEENISPAVFANALQAGVDTAYKAVIKPVEGTILTVAKKAALAGLKASRSGSINSLMEQVLKESLITLEKTPELLPVLKQAGVVDAGGKGLCYIFMGWLDYLEGRVSDGLESLDYQQSAAVPEHVGMDLEFGYCTEFIVTGQNLSEEVFRSGLGSHGDSLLVVGTSGLIKIHIHTNNPGLVLDFALSHGKELQDIKIDNMRFQHRELHSEQPQTPEGVQERKRNGVVAVAAGPGLEEIFKSMGVDYVVAGGQTMNPSTEDMLHAFEHLNTERIVVLPNNSNIIMAAKQAAEIAGEHVEVVASKSIPQGLSAMLNFSPDEQDFTQLLKAMETGLTTVQTGQVTFAVRDSVFDGQPISEGNILGIADGKIVAVDGDISDTTLKLVEIMVNDQSELITLFYGEDVQREDAEKIAASLSEAHPDCEIELHPGGQPIYYYIIAIE